MRETEKERRVQPDSIFFCIFLPKDACKADFIQVCYILCFQITECDYVHDSIERFEVSCLSNSTHINAMKSPPINAKALVAKPKRLGLYRLLLLLLLLFIKHMKILAIIGLRKALHLRSMYLEQPKCNNKQKLFKRRVLFVVF